VGKVIDTFIPLELIKNDKWVLWRNEDKVNLDLSEETVSKYTKKPFQINGNFASSTIPSTWSSFGEVRDNIKNYDGIGYVLCKEDGYIVIDLDDCVFNGVISARAMEIIQKLNSYTEYSQSGKGIHIFIKGQKPGPRCRNMKEKFEMYDDKQFIAMTGNHVKETPHGINKAQNVINYLYNLYLFQESLTDKYSRLNCIQTSPQMTDDKIIRKASEAKNGQTFINLYNGDYSLYDSASEADQALCFILAFYTQQFNQIDRLFSNSKLYREKWDRIDYKEKTIMNAITQVTNYYQPKKSNLKNENLKNKTLQNILRGRRDKEVNEQILEWEKSGKKGGKPSSLSAYRCAIILNEYINFILFDLEENTRLAMYLPEEGIYTRNTTIIKRVISWLEPGLNSNRAEDVIYHIKNKAVVRRRTVSRYLIPVKNGVFNLKTRKLEPFTPEYVFTTKIETPYIYNLENPIIDDWDIESWLNSIACDDKEIVKLLWQVINDSIQGNYSRKKAIFLVGDGNNGKGTFQELIVNLIGLENIATLKVNEFDERFRLSVIEGKTAIIGDDVPANVFIDDSSNFNSVVSGDIVSVEYKNRQPFSTSFKCCVLQSTNGMPRFRNKSNGTIRRIIIVPFNANFNGFREDYKIKEEYIKNEQVLQYVLYKAINMDFEKFDIPAVSEQMLEEFKQDNDPIMDFKCSFFDHFDLEEIPKSIVYEMYKYFCSENGYKSLSTRQFHHQFKKNLNKAWVDGQRRFKIDELRYFACHISDEVKLPRTDIPLRTYKHKNV